MSIGKDVQEFIRNSPKTSRKIISEVVDLFDLQGCTAYVKTIYVGFEISGEMVAALYPREQHVEIALALDEDHADQRLKDATHLTWRTLPLLLELSSVAAVSGSIALFEEACDRVRTSTHQVMRDNEFFASAKQRRKPGRSRQK